MQREGKAYLWDISNAAASLRDFTGGKDLAVYLQDEMLREEVAALLDEPDLSS